MPFVLVTELADLAVAPSELPKALAIGLALFAGEMGLRVVATAAAALTISLEPEALHRLGVVAGLGGNTGDHDADTDCGSCER